MTMVGGIIQKIGGYTGVFSGSPPTVIHGFQPGGAYYDLRLMNDAPPFFATTASDIFFAQSALTLPCLSSEGTIHFASRAVFPGY
jgi:hypothetical protein